MGGWFAGIQGNDHSLLALYRILARDNISGFRMGYEGGIRLPMIVLWTGRIQAGQASSLPWAQWDFMVDLGGLAGAPGPPRAYGISALQTL